MDLAQPRTRDAAPANLLADEEVVRRVCAGERDLYELLLRRHNQRVYRAVRAIVHEEAEVEDVMQQAYVLAYRHLAQFGGLARFSTWLIRIAINEALARTRRPARLVSLDDDGPDASTLEGRTEDARATPEEEVQRREMIGLVEEALLALPEIYRSVLMLREVEGLSTAEVAAALEVTEDVVKTRLHRARGLLQQRLRARATAADLSAAFPFEARRCDRVVAFVMTTIADESPPAR